MTDALLRVNDLRVEFRTDDGVVKAVDGVSFDLQAGQTLGIVGESGSGKSVTNLAIMGLVPQPPGRVTAGQAMYRGSDLLQLPPRDLAAIRGRHIAMIFQDPMTALNPFLTVEEQLTEVTRLHLGYDRATAIAHAIEMLERVGIASARRRIYDYPHQFSGGMRQRVMIAMALSCKPDVLIADEPSTALDVTIQAQILDLIKDLQKSDDTAVILITHDMGVIANICHRVLVMYAGKVVEEADVDSLFDDPRHPYTLGLLESVPRLDEAVAARLRPIEGQPPDLAHLPRACAFEPRCRFAEDRCRNEVPSLVEDAGGGRSACFVMVQQQPSEEAGRG